MFDAIPASVIIFMARNIMAELHHVFLINVLQKIAFGLVLREIKNAFEFSGFRLSSKHACPPLLCYQKESV